jgi:hypothetical protein
LNAAVRVELRRFDTIQVLYSGHFAAFSSSGVPGIIFPWVSTNSFLINMGALVCMLHRAYGYLKKL